VTGWTVLAEPAFDEHILGYRVRDWVLDPLPAAIAAWGWLAGIQARMRNPSS
jgi:hypothetical protein